MIEKEKNHVSTKQKDIIETISNVIGRFSEIDDDLALDSISFIKIIVMLESKYNIEFDSEDLIIAKFLTSRSFIDYVETRIGS
jgi:acyl carrier protein